MTNERPTPKPRRRWYQFSLRTLLIVVTLSAVPLGWFAWKVEQGRRQERRERPVIAWVEKMGGSVQFGGGWVDSWFGLGKLFVNLESTQVRDLSPLVELKNLQALKLSNTQIGDLSSLAELKNLVCLELDSTQVNDEQVQTLEKALPNCHIVR